MDIPVPKYKIGDKVFTANRYNKRKKITCPDCLGQLRWTVSAPSGETWEASCRTCEYGYDGSRGYIERWEMDNNITKLTIGSVRIDTHKEDDMVSYMCCETGIGSGTVYKETMLHSTKEDAEAWCLIESQRQADAENARLGKIEADNKKKSRSKPTNDQRYIKNLETRIAELEKKLSKAEGE